MVRRGAALPADPLVLMQASEGRTPLFVFRGVGGMVLELFDLGRLVRHRGPIYANQFRGVSGKEPPPAAVPDVARYQRDVVRAVQPQGPYRLARFSLGGLVALELARLLTDEGENVAFVGLIEPNLPERIWPASVKRAKTHIGTLRALSPGEAVDYAAARAKPLFNRLRRAAGGRANSDGSAAASSPYRLEGLPPGLAEMREAGLNAFYAYDIAPYDGKVAFFDSEGGDPLSCRPLDVFPKYLRNYEAFISGGDHATMLRQPHVSQLAAQISAFLSKLDLS